MKLALRPNAELTALARGINSRESTLMGIEKRTLDSVAEWLREALLQGADLLRARAQLKHGDWLDWLVANCPAVHYLKANRYMHLAANLSRVRNLTGAESLRQALELCGIPVDRPESAGTKQWPPYLEAIGRLSKFRGFLKQHPLAKMPAEGLDKIREDLQPIAAQLWPEKFPDKP